MSATLSEAYRRLFEAFGPQHWWPGQSPFEVMVGAVLTQNTSWRNVERAIGNLREADLLEPRALYDVPVEELEELIRPAGYFRVKARRLRNLVAFIVEQYEGSLDAVFRSDVADLRRQLLASTALVPRRPIRSCSTRAAWRASSSTPTRTASSRGTAGSTSTPPTMKFRNM